MSASSPVVAGGRLPAAFAALKGDGRSALIAYVTAGHPSLETTLPLLNGLADAGVDILEVGVPFSDPIADGPTIQASSFQAIKNGADLAWSLDIVAQFRKERETPIVLFTYLNPVMRFGVETFARRAVEVGVDAVLLTDLPAGADPKVEGALRENGIGIIRLIAPTTRPARMREILAVADGFVYYVSRAGVTGARAELPTDVGDHVAMIKSLTSLPVAVGFGISTAEQASIVAKVADGVVVGSALVERVGREGVDASVAWMRSLREAMNVATRGVTQK